MGLEEAGGPGYTVAILVVPVASKHVVFSFSIVLPPYQDIQTCYNRNSPDLP